MGNRGRYGKYGEIKRVDRLRRARAGPTPFRRPPAHLQSPRHLSEKRVEGKGRIKIRPAEPSDTPFITELSGRVFHVYGPYEKVIQGWLESGMTVTLLALMGKHPAGFGMITHFPGEGDDRHASELLAIAVLPERQRMGIGQRLLQALEKKAAEMQVRELFLHTAEENIPAQALFASNGYRSWGTKRSFYPAGQSALLMSKKIHPQIKE